MRRKNSVREEAGDRSLYPQKVISNVLGRQYKIGQEMLEEEIEDD